jgi:hypothetical protein
MKIIFKEITSEDDKRECDREVDIIMRANSEHIVKRFESFMANKNYCVVYEYCAVSIDVFSRLFCSNRKSTATLGSILNSIKIKNLF